ncbi:MAG: glycosyltransferase family 2 protein [bacterium]
MKLSVVILTKDNEKNIESALKSASFAEEIIILDDNSQDETKDIARKYEATVIQRSLNEDFAQQRNYGLKKAIGDWILFLDADEVITNELQKEIVSTIKKNNKILGYYIKRRDIFWGRVLKHGEVKKTYREGIIRFFKKNSGLWERPVHEAFVHKGYFGQLSGFIEHYSHNGIKDFIRNINFYSTIRAKELANLNTKSNILQIFFFPTAKFILNYIFRLGFLDGVEGFVYAFMMSFHSFLVKAKLYQYNNLSK